MGTTGTFKRPRYFCGYCGGTGHRVGTSALPCLVCGGSGRRPHKLKKLCTLCEGSGLRLGSLALPCPACGGWGYTE